MLDDPVGIARPLRGNAGTAVGVPCIAHVAEGRLPALLSLVADAEADKGLVARLLAMPACNRLAAARHEPAYRRPSLAKFLTLIAEAALFDRSADARPLAELAAAVASVVAADPFGAARRQEALAHWLFGKALLQAGQGCLAQHRFKLILARMPDDLSEERALALTGLAQVAADAGDVDTAAVRFLWAACLFADRGAPEGCCACNAELGLLLLEVGDLLAAQESLQSATSLLDEAAAPALAARLRLALAEIATVLRKPQAAAVQLVRAQALAPLLPVGATTTEGLVRSWREGRIAAAAGDAEHAEAHLDAVRRHLLSRGSLGEAVRSTFDHLLLAIDAQRFEGTQELLDALARAFPGPGERWAQEMEQLVFVAAAQPEGLYRASWKLRDRLRQPDRYDPRRPPLLTPVRHFCDRLVRRRTDLEDPIGAATGL